MLAVGLVGAEPSAAQKVLEENPYYLRADESLQVSFNLETDRPKLLQIVAKLREATGLEIGVASNLADHDPDFGKIQPSKKGYRAWQLMEMVARKELQNGYWEKTDLGYRLVATSSIVAVTANPPPAEGSRVLTVWLAISACALFVVALALLALRKRRARSGPG